MKWLLILLIASQIVFSTKGLAQGVIDTNWSQAMNNLRHMAASMSNKKCANVEDIRISDSGDFPTTVIFRHILTAEDSLYREENFEDALPIITIRQMFLPDFFNKEDTQAVASYPINIIDEESLSVAGLKPAPVACTSFHNEDTLAMAPDTIYIFDADTLPLADLKPTPVSRPTHLKAGTVKPPPLPPLEIRRPVAEMHLSEDGYSLLQKLEGYAPDLYNLGDGGYTIGFGFFIPYNEGSKFRKGITWDAAMEMMQEKMPEYEDQVKKYINVLLTQNEFDALTMLAYNLGGFSKATSIINDINEDADFSQLQKDWRRFVHSKAANVSKGLLNRRNDELGVRRSSDYQPDRKIQIFKK